MQIRGSRDYWKVTDTEDILHDDEFINFEVHVQKINVEGLVTRPILAPGPTYNLHGTHARVNTQSRDHSINISHQTATVLADIRQAIRANIQDTEERSEILRRLEELEAAKGTSGFLKKYQSLLPAAAANHMDLMAPFIPALTVLLA